MHGEKNAGTRPDQGDDGLVVAFAFGAFVVAISPGRVDDAGRRRTEGQGSLEFLIAPSVGCSPLTEVPERHVTGAVPAYAAKWAAEARCLPVTKDPLSWVEGLVCDHKLTSGVAGELHRWSRD